MEPQRKHKIQPKSLGLFLIIYGVLYVVWDRIDYLIQSYFDTYVFRNIYAEPIVFRMANIIFCFALVAGAYCLMQKRKEAWYLINFGSIGILIKYLYTFLFVHSSGNFLSFFGIHAIVVIVSLKLINGEKYKSEIDFNPAKPKKALRLMFAVCLSIVVFFGFEHSLWYSLINYNKKHYKEVIFDTNQFYPADTCYFANEFCSIVDTLKNISDYTSIYIVELDSNLIPQYVEELDKYDYDIKSHYFQYDSNRQEITFIKKEDFDEIDIITIAYDYTKDFKKLPRLDLPKDWEETTINFNDATKPMTKISSIYASDSKWPIEKIFTVFVEEKPLKPERAYCIHRPWYIRLYQLSYFEEDT